MKVKDICDLQNGRAFKPDDWETEGLPIVRIQNLNDESAPFNYYAGDYSSVHEINDGELLFSWSGTPGTSFGAFRWYRGKGILNQHIFKVLPKIDIDKEYLKYALNGNIDAIIAKAHGGVGLQHITKKELDEIDIPIVSKREQLAIVERIIHVERLIAMRKRELTLLDDLIRARFIEMFGDININDKNWECEPLGDLCSIVRGSSPRPIEQFLGGDIPWIKIGDATDGDNIYLSSTKEHIVKEGIKKSRLVKAGSLIFANCGVSLGFARIITFDGCIHDGWLAMEDIDERLDKVFLLQTLNQMTEHFRAIAPAGTQPNLNTAIMKSYKQVIPPIELQRKFISFVQQVDKSKFMEERNIFYGRRKESRTTSFFLCRHRYNQPFQPQG